MSSTGLSVKIATYIAEKSATKIEDLEKLRKKIKENGQLTAISDEPDLAFKEALQKKHEQFKPANWLTEAARRAGQIQEVTHVLKFAHTAAEGSSLRASQEKNYPAGFPDGGIISTAFLSNLDPDFVGNAAALDVVKLLLIRDEDNSKTLIDFIQKGDMSPFAPFAENETQLEEWRKGFMKIWASKEPASHTFSKQVYFPIDKGQYHLLSPLHASSFAHEIHKQVKNSRFSDQAKLSRQAKRESKYSNTRVVDYRNTAIQTYGGTKPQNVSQLNNSRGGKIFLLSCAPPSWETRLKPPLETKTIFSRGHFEKRVREEVFALREYLKKQRNKKSVKSVRDCRKEQVDSIIDHLIQYGAEIRNLQDESGWSSLPTCKLPRAQQLWLDPRRTNDETFALELTKNDWQEQLAGQFAHWLNLRLTTKELHFGDVEYQEWKDLLEEALRTLKNDLEVFS